jgi:two-component system, sensor histidine kinase PdtaS
VRFGADSIAVVTREANVATARSPSNLELTYLQSAADLAQMLADGTFPYPQDRYEERDLSPRVGDGIIRIDGRWRVSFASPNAVSAYRRLGSLESVVGQHLLDFEPDADDFVDALANRRPFDHETESEGAVVLRRLLPLVADDRVIGGLLLVREITELRGHERALRVKDATIREIHHRVKNNLQTVASLLRLQGRRLRSDEARAALAESVRRIASIALVHETLAQDSRQRVSFDKISSRIVDMLADGLVSPDAPIAFAVEGSPGDLPAEVATPLALVLTELLQNSVEHAFPDRAPPAPGQPVGSVRVVFERGPTSLRVVVADDGVGLPEGQGLEDISNLGLQIARTLVETELGGTFKPLEDQQGTAIEIILPLA